MGRNSLIYESVTNSEISWNMLDVNIHKIYGENIKIYYEKSPSFEG